MNNSIENKIEKLIEEVLLLAAPALYPMISHEIANIEADNIKTKKDLQNFKSRYTNYQNYDSLGNNIKRGLKAGAFFGVPVGGIIASGGEPEDIESGLGVSGLFLASGLGGALLHTGIERLFGNSRLKDIILEKEKELSKGIKNEERSIK